MCVCKGILCKKHFIEFVLVETNQLFSGHSNVILTRQTCDQCGSGMATAERSFFFPGRSFFPHSTYVRVYTEFFPKNPFLFLLFPVEPD